MLMKHIEMRIRLEVVSLLCCELGELWHGHISMSMRCAGNLLRALCTGKACNEGQTGKIMFQHVPSHERLWSLEGWKDLYRFALKLEPQGPQLGSCEIAKKHAVCSCEGLSWMNWSPAMRRCCCNKSEGGE